MVLMLAMQVSDECDERTEARIRTYVRVLKRFEELDYDIDEAEENLEEYGIDYFANQRKKNKTDDVEDNDSDDEGDDDSDDSKNDELDDLRDSDDEDDDDDDDDDTESSVTTSLSKSSKGAKSVSSKSSDKPLSEKFVNYFKQNGIKDENFVIWVKDGKVQKSNDSALLLKLKAFDFTDL